MPKIPEHHTPRGTWCAFSGVDSVSGTCHMCGPCPECKTPAGKDCAPWCTGATPAGSVSREADELPWLGDIDRRADDDVEFCDEGDYLDP